MTHYYSLWMRTVSAENLTWRIHATLWAQAAAGMIISESSRSVNFQKLYWVSEKFVTVILGALRLPPWPIGGARAPFELCLACLPVPDRRSAAADQV